MMIEVISASAMRAHLDTLAEMLVRSVENGALVGYVLPFDAAGASIYWHDVARCVDAGERLLVCAFADDRVVGTVQLYLSPEPNAPHRAEVYKLLVDPQFQRRGIGVALMQFVEDEARRQNRSLLLLDTVEGGASERLYRRMGWQEVGVVPHHFVDPHGRPRASVYFMKHLPA